MKYVINTLCLVELVVTLNVFLGLSIYWRFTNLDMTEARFVVTFWKGYALAFLLFAIFGIGDRLTRSK